MQGAGSVARVSFSQIFFAVLLWFVGTFVAATANRWKIWRWLILLPPIAIACLFFVIAPRAIGPESSGAEALGLGLYGALLFWPWLVGLGLSAIVGTIQRLTPTKLTKEDK